ncbi:MAG: hypothetical protein J0H69_12770 [Burkholderiales bacterium]|nr:hypothetical protein [Burkholderiales bacterium]
MTSMPVRALCALVGLPQVIAGIALAIYAIWFADPRQAGVGAVVGHTADVLLLSLLTQILAAILWLCWRRRRAERRLLRQTWVASMITLVVLFVLIEQLQYTGVR